MDAPLQRILVAVDFSPSSLAALEFAALVGALDASIVDVLHVWQTNTLTPVTVAGPQAKQELRSFVAGFDFRGVSEVRRRVEHGDPYLTVYHLAANYDAIVVGLRGRGAAATRGMGHVTASLLGTTDAPVFVIPPQRSPGQTRTQGVKRVVAIAEPTRGDRLDLTMVAGLAK